MANALVVDDNEVNRILASRLLSKAGWTVSEADDGPAAITWLEGNSVELILLDVSMPAMTGEEVCRIIRERSLGGAQVKVVAYTAHAQPEQLAHFLASGFDNVLLKPLSRARLATVLAAVGYPVPEAAPNV